MAKISSIMSLVFLVCIGHNTAWAQVGVPLIYRAVPAQVLPGQAPLAQVRLYRLRNAQAGFVADELATVLAQPDVRIVSDARTNSVIVASPPGLQATVADLIARLDVFQAPGGTAVPTSPTALTGNAPATGVQGGAVANALDQLLSQNGTLPQGSQIAVIRISPAAARALATLVPAQPAQQPQPILQPQFGQQPQPTLPSPPAQPPQLGQQPLEYQALKPPLNGTSMETPQLPGGLTRTFTIDRDEVTALAKALGSLSAQGTNSGALVVVPPETPSPGELPSPPEATSRPGAKPR